MKKKLDGFVERQYGQTMRTTKFTSSKFGSMVVTQAIAIDHCRMNTGIYFEQNFVNRNIFSGKDKEKNTAKYVHSLREITQNYTHI